MSNKNQSEENKNSRILELEQERNFYKRIADSTYDLEFFHDPKAVPIYINNASQSITGYEPEEFLKSGLKFRDFVHPEDRELFIEKLEEAIQKQIDIRDFTYRLIRQDKQTRYVNQYSVPIFENGKFIGLRSSIRDITDEQSFNELKKLNTEYLNIIEKLNEAKKSAEESQLLFRRLFNSMEEGVYLHEMMFDLEGNIFNYRIIDGNPASEKHLGINLETAKNQIATELYKTNEAPFLDRYIVVMKSGEAEIFEQYFEPLKKWFRISAFKVDETMFATVFDDISETVNTKNELLKNQYKLTEAQKIAKIGHWEIDHQKQTLYWSDETYRIFDINSGDIEINYNNYLDFVHPDDRQFVISSFTNHLNNKDDFDIMYRILIQNDTIKHIRNKCKTHFNTINNPINSIGVLIDVTDQINHQNELKMAKETAEASELKIHTIINSVPDLVWLKDTDGVFMMCNKSFEEYFGKSKNDIIGRTDYDFVDKETADFFRKRDRIALQAGKPTINEERVTYADGHEEFLETIKTPLLGANKKVIGILGIGRKITDRKKTEADLIAAKNKAEESDRLKSTFLSNMSHEIRTPMNGIIGFADLLHKDDIEIEEQKKFVRIIQNSGTQLLRIIDDILEISRLETRQVKAIFENLFLNDMLREIHSIFQVNNQIKNIDFKLHLDLPDNKSFISTDRSKLSKVLSNLIENAFRYTKQGSIELGYVVENVEIVLYVKDTGIGIAKEKQKYIFERFRQGDVKLSQRSGGLGLGLSIAKENTELIGGKISVKSEPGKGTTFYVRIPFTQGHNDRQQVTEVLKPKINNKAVVLVVEDDKINYIFLKTLLNLEPYNITVIHAHDGKKALDVCIERNDISLVLMDIRMPKMDGYETTRQIKKIYKNLPVIAQTAYATNEEKKKAFESGCDDYIAKPIDPELLRVKLAKYLGN